ncbi:MAG: hypothetical protein JSW27_15120, partial [Phycisphaerales bacterium]
MKAKRILPILGLAACATLLCAEAPAAKAAHSVAHTHIGVNPTWRPTDWNRPTEGAIDPDPTDNSQLWFFSVPATSAGATPGWPNWEQTDGRAFLVLMPVMEGEEPLAKPGDPNKVLYTCSFTYSKADGYGDP